MKGSVHHGGMEKKEIAAILYAPPCIRSPTNKLAAEHLTSDEVHDSTRRHQDTKKK